MPKKFTNVIDRGRVTANKYNLTNNGDGTAIITDIESNINVPGTPLNKELFNPMQEGLIFTVETVHTIENSTDVYELEIDGLQGTSNLNGMPLFKGLSFNIKISETNTTNVVKIKISGNKYDLAKESGDTVVNLTVGELKRNRYYKVIFDSVRFTIPVEIIEYNPMFGANFGGLLGTPGTKKVGVAYYDVANNQTVVPTVENSLTYFESSKFIPISDYQTAKKLENLYENWQLVFNGLLQHIARKSFVIPVPKKASKIRILSSVGIDDLYNDWVFQEFSFSKSNFTLVNGEHYLNFFKETDKYYYFKVVSTTSVDDNYAYIYVK